MNLTFSLLSSLLDRVPSLLLRPYAWQSVAPRKLDTARLESAHAAVNSATTATDEPSRQHLGTVIAQTCPLTPQLFLQSQSGTGHQLH